MTFIETFFEAALQYAFPPYLMVALNEPFLVSFNLKVAFPLEFVFALNVFPATFMVTLALLMAFPLLFFKTIEYFLTFLTFNVSFLAVIFEEIFLTVTFSLVLVEKYFAPPR